jgi:hypothetical protein
MLIFPLPPDHGLQRQLIAPLFGLEVFVELFPLGLGNAGFNAVGSSDGYYVSCKKMGALIVLDNQQKVPGRDKTWLPLSVLASSYFAADRHGIMLKIRLSDKQVVS